MADKWYLAGGVEPTSVFEAGDGWQFASNVQPATCDISCLVLFECTLSAPQVRVATDLLEKGVVSPGRFVTWQQFADLYGVT